MILSLGFEPNENVQVAVYSRPCGQNSEWELGPIQTRACRVSKNNVSATKKMAQLDPNLAFWMRGSLPMIGSSLGAIGTAFYGLATIGFCAEGGLANPACALGIGATGTTTLVTLLSLDGISDAAYRSKIEAAIKSLASSQLRRDDKHEDGTDWLSIQYTFDSILTDSFEASQKLLRVTNDIAHDLTIEGSSDRQGLEGCDSESTPAAWAQ